MRAQPHLYKLNPESELAQRLRQADIERQSVTLEVAGVRYRVVRQIDTAPNAEDPFAGYNPERMREAIRAGAGTLRGVDRNELLADLRAQRGQDSMGRPAE